MCVYYLTGFFSDLCVGWLLQLFTHGFWEVKRRSSIKEGRNSEAGTVITNYECWNHIMADGKLLEYNSCIEGSSYSETTN